MKRGSSYQGVGEKQLMTARPAAGKMRGIFDRIKVHVSAGKGYDIMIGSGLLEMVGACLEGCPLGTQYYVVSDRTVYRLYGRRLEAGLARSGYALIGRSIVPAREESKSLEIWKQVLDCLVQAEDGMQRRVFIVALGGGVVGDLAGFVAATYRRGIPYVQIPTTLIAQVDSSVGGKTGVNHPAGKNLIGAFHQPAAVVIDLDSLHTLPDREVRSGLVEVIKYGIIEDERLFSYIEKRLVAIQERRQDALLHIIDRSCRIKARIVEEDEKEHKGIRTVLNLGHTLGHALEAATDYRRYRHGEAVGLGILCAARIAILLGRFSERGYARVRNLLSEAGLPVVIKGVSFKRIWEAMKHDKKFIHGKTRLVLPLAIGRVEVLEDIDHGIIEQAISTLFAERS